ncbi:MAG: peptide chain release factor 2 [Clostridia bacterium]|nr:peptide chain release factor 2 [Clostridia bacterium]
MLRLEYIKQEMPSVLPVLSEVRNSFDLERVKEELARLNREIEEPHFWDEIEAAQKKMKEKKVMENTIGSFEALEKKVSDISEMMELCEILEPGSDELNSSVKSIEDDFAKLKTDIENLRLTTLLTGKYDHNGAILSIHAGTGGIDAQDWAEMLLRMYTRFCDSKGYQVKLIDIERDTEGGIKTATISVDGENAYGYLRNEKGVHRLVRISPYNAQNKRQTSFAKIDVMPEIEGDTDIEIDPNDLRIDTYRASGAGGQHVNKTESAVRITHIPTGVVVTCQNERSQIQNREVAMNVLKSRLLEMKEAQQKEDLKELKGEDMLNAWGSQIRSYVFQPYTLVKDHRTGAETSDVTSVMDGNIEFFINEKLKQKDQKND